MMFITYNQDFIENVLKPCAFSGRIFCSGEERQEVVRAIKRRIAGEPAGVAAVSDDGSAERRHRLHRQQQGRPPPQTHRQALRSGQSHQVAYQTLRLEPKKINH